MKIVVCDFYSIEALSRLRVQLNADIVKSAGRTPTTSELADCQGLLIRSGTAVTAALLAQAPQLKLVVSATSGFDHIDIRACHERGVKPYHTPMANRESAAEHALLLTLALQRQLLAAHKSVIENSWRQTVPRGHELKGRHFGIVGLGRVGTRVAELAKAFGVTLAACDPYQDEKVFRELGAERLAFTELLKLCDIISFHVPLTNETRGMLARPTLSLMKQQPLIINTSRGEVVDENELIWALEEGVVRGAGLDVFQNEPIYNSSRLLKLPNVVLTPHIGAYTEEAFQAASEAAVNKVLQFFAGQEPEDLLSL